MSLLRFVPPRSADFVGRGCGGRVWPAVHLERCYEYLVVIRLDPMDVSDEDIDCHLAKPLSCYPDGTLGPHIKRNQWKSVGESVESGCGASYVSAT